jgi:hypothetical protein
VTPWIDVILEDAEPKLPISNSSEEHKLTRNVQKSSDSFITSVIDTKTNMGKKMDKGELAEYIRLKRVHLLFTDATSKFNTTKHIINKTPKTIQ